MSFESEINGPLRKVPKIRESIAPMNENEVIVNKGKSSYLIAKLQFMSSAKAKKVILVISSFLIGCFFTIFVTSNLETTKPVSSSNLFFTDVVAGKIALSEKDLIAAVKKLGIAAYWVGPVKGASYTISVPVDGQAYIRYLPNGQGLEDKNANYVVIATYTTTNAFAATQAAGNQSNGVTFINTEGAAVYYNKDTPTNVYVAYPNLNFQIEVFNPISTTALEIGSKKGALRLVK